MGWGGGVVPIPFSIPSPPPPSPNPGTMRFLDSVKNQDTKPLLVRVILDLFNTKTVKVESAKELIMLFNPPLNNKNSTPIKHTEKK